MSLLFYADIVLNRLKPVYYIVYDQETAGAQCQMLPSQYAQFLLLFCCIGVICAFTCAYSKCKEPVGGMGLDDTFEWKNESPARNFIFPF